MRNDFQSNYLMHHGILGQKWGIRNYQNPDGSLTEAGRKRYGVGPGRSADDVSSAKGYNRRIKDLNKAIEINEKKRGKEHTKIANNPENFLGLNKKHANKIDEYSKNIEKGKKELEALLAKAEKEGYEVKRGKVKEASQKEIDKLLAKDFDGDKATDEEIAKVNQAVSKANSKFDGSFGKIPNDLKKYYSEDDAKNISYTKQKIGNDKVDFEINNSRYDSSSRKYVQDEPQEVAVARAQKFLKEFDVDKAKESITKEYYDNFAEDYKEQGLTREEFKEALTPYKVDITRGEAYVCFDDGGNVGYHSLDVGLDPDTMKIKYHSMNG